MLKSFMSSLLLMICMSCSSEETKLLYDQFRYISDIDRRYRIDYFKPGVGGKDVIWDMTDFFTYGHEESINYDVDNVTGVIIAEYVDHIEKYRQTSDSLLLLEKESPQQRTVYTNPLLLMTYPIQYGDSISSTYEGKGIYCGKYSYVENGRSMTKCDAIGTIILPEEDSLQNVLRTYTLNVYNIRMCNGTTISDSTQSRQVIEEQHKWFAKDLRYPIVESCVRTCYYNMKQVSYSRHAYCRMPEVMSVAEGKNMEEYEKNGSEVLHNDIIHYDICINGPIIEVHYSLDREAHIVALVTDAMGIVYRKEENVRSACLENIIEIDCSALNNSKNYILYLNVNGKIYSEKIKL